MADPYSGTPLESTPSSEIPSESAGQSFSAAAPEKKYRFPKFKYLKIVLPALLVAALPVGVFMSQQQQNTQSRASAATVLSFTPQSSVATPIIKNVGDTVVVDVMADPGTNLLSSLSMDINYDPTKLEFEKKEDFQFNEELNFKTNLVINEGSVKARAVASFDMNSLIKNKTKIATITFKAIAPTAENSHTLIQFNTSSMATSAGPEDQAAENVLSSTIPAVIKISGDALVPEGEIEEETADLGGRGIIMGKYVDSKNNLEDVKHVRVTVIRDGNTKGNFKNDSPRWEFNREPGVYTVKISPRNGYTTFIGECGNCPKSRFIKRDSLQVTVKPNKKRHLSIKFVKSDNVKTEVSPTSSTASPTATTMPTPTIQGELSAACRSDLDKNGTVTNEDYVLFNKDFASCYGVNPLTDVCSKIDLVKDGKVDEFDQNFIGRNGGKKCP